jgi:hypothetical protein
MSTQVLDLPTRLALAKNLENLLFGEIDSVASSLVEVLRRSHSLGWISCEGAVHRTMLPLRLQTQVTRFAFGEFGTVHKQRAPVLNRPITARSENPIKSPVARRGYN